MTGEKRALRMFIGPVQGFIAAGRRTRDFWAGSFLLSRLTGEAMAAIAEHDDASITIPAVQTERVVTEPTLKKIMATRARGDRLPEDKSDWAGPLVGTLVNHFRAEMPADLDLDAVENELRARFRKIAKKVCDHFIAEALDDYVSGQVDAAGKDPGEAPEKRRERRDAVRTRWEAQTSGAFFEVLWVTGPIGDGRERWRAESRWLDRRKTVRTHAPIDETAHGLKGTGDRCPVHPDLCEIGGFSRVFERTQQDQFWECVRRVVGRRMYPEWASRGEQFRDTLELREGERLSAMALVKRLFPLLPPEALVECIGWIPSFYPDIDTPPVTWTPEDAQRTLRNWPSTAFIAAIPWIVLAGKGAASEAEAYAEAQYRRLGADPILEEERPQHHRIEGIGRLDRVERIRGGKTRREVPLFAVLDGTLHFPRGLEKHRFVSQRVLQASGKASDELKKAELLAKDLKKRFDSFVKDAAEALKKPPPAIDKLREPPARPFYAMLEMDGDSMGTIFSRNLKQARNCSKALLEFAGRVPAIVRHHDGVLIFAGADDVNAMLPIDTAIACAMAIRSAWQEVMATYFPAGADCAAPTLSGSIVFADYQNALDDVRRLAHRRLDAVAKDGMGRNALALAVMKSGGVTAEWASSWDGPQAGDGEAPTQAPPDALIAYANTAATAKALAKRLPYLIRQRFTPVLDATKDGTGAAASELFDDERFTKFIAKEIVDSSLFKAASTEHERAERALEAARRIVFLMRPHGRATMAGNPPPLRHVGGLLIADFLAENMLWPYVGDWKDRAPVEDGGAPS